MGLFLTLALALDRARDFEYIQSDSTGKIKQKNSYLDGVLLVHDFCFNRISNVFCALNGGLNPLPLLVGLNIIVIRWNGSK